MKISVPRMIVSLASNGIVGVIKTVFVERKIKTTQGRVRAIKTAAGRRPIPIVAMKTIAAALSPAAGTLT